MQETRIFFRSSFFVFVSALIANLEKKLSVSLSNTCIPELIGGVHGSFGA